MMMTTGQPAGRPAGRPADDDEDDEVMLFFFPDAFCGFQLNSGSSFFNFVC